MTIEEKVESVLNALRPFLMRDGGNCELVCVDDGIAYLRLLGACSSCSISTVTLKSGIQQALIEEIPEIVGVEEVTY